MRLTYKPADGTEQSWIFRPGDLPRTVCSQLQKVYGKPYDVFEAEVQQGDIDARAVALWHCMRSEHPLLKFEDLPDFKKKELTVSYEAEELREILKQTEARASALPADQREMALASLRADLAEIEAAEAADPGKASKPKAAG
ncbi:hypothetical protein [Paractinoplanes atraurantiacus]|uniref:Uncharacterized protein n=1 Tax=Paractinoplanes atraurantiacus TaxID=1036182 RepID=A0A285GZZ0_9ACTN|nr:hypothetical protein [Actinoplanes atraurantiacus]SNY29067.1 hypothetical protein SAMN05421748_103186 [Actinoplanes atraurantiacus]